MSFICSQCWCSSNALPFGGEEAEGVGSSRDRTERRGLECKKKNSYKNMYVIVEEKPKMAP